jgi:predicted ATPase
MFTKLRIQNFKAWQDTGLLNLAPLTVLFGVNSAGKSSITQLLLALKQTVESPDRQRVLHLGDRYSLVDLGTFHDMVRDHDLSRAIQFEFEWTLPKSLSIRDPKKNVYYEGNTLKFVAAIQSELGQIHVNRMAYHLIDPDNQDRLSVSLMPDKKAKYRLKAEHYSLVRMTGRSWPLPPPVKFYGFPDEAVAYYQNSGFVADLTLELERLFGRLYYLGPLRGYPARTYVWSGEIPDHAGIRGERAIEAILAAHNRQISRGKKKIAQPFAKVIARWLHDMKLIDSFDLKPIAENRKEYEVIVQTARNSIPVNLTDVGFGLSQVLPVIVQCFYVPAHSTIIFEQPEIHLHPRVQADLADLFIESIHAREGGDDRSIQLIVESHSEHFLRRLQRRIAEEVIKPKDVAIYFCEIGPQGSTIRPLDLDLYGYISNWPDNFFGDEMGDLAAMTEAAMRRQMTEDA